MKVTPFYGMDLLDILKIRNFANGSIKIAKKIIENNKSNKIYSVVGGGDTVSLLNSINAVNDFNFVSTAGGAFLEYLEGKELPGIKALN
jgi:phosphoglycerate kinase